MDKKAAKKPNKALSHASLNALARKVSAKRDQLGMCLNIPTKRLVDMTEEDTVDGVEMDDIRKTARMLIMWSTEIKQTATDKVKKRELSTALRDIKYKQYADIFEDKFDKNVEMTADCFPPI